ncbi:MAG: peptidoglycan DL-endopeptidase CwlO [Frankiales bacterium]|nr:peptidoglycan DL-endopeptidase CwlO [Frankiales bacterium]
MTPFATGRPASRWAAGLALGGLLSFAALGVVVGAAPRALASPLGDAQSRAATLRQRVDALRNQAEIATERYDEAYAALGQAVNAHIEAQRVLDSARDASVATDDQRAQRARALYMSGGPSAIYATVLSSGSITEVASRIHQVQIVLGGDTRSVQRANDTVVRLAAAQQTLADSEGAANRLQKQVSDQADRVNHLLAQTNQLLATADKQIRDLAEQQRQAAAAAAASRAAAALAAARGDVGTLPDVAASPLAAAVLAFAQAQLGKPYLWGATGPGAFDCSGLTGAAYAAAGLPLPRTSREQWYAGPHVALGQLEPGDLLFWASDLADPSTIHHVALYAGNGLMVAAPHTGDVVRVQPVYLDGYIGAVRPGAAVATQIPTSPTSTLAVGSGG